MEEEELNKLCIIYPDNCEQIIISANISQSIIFLCVLYYFYREGIFKNIINLFKYN